MYCAAVRAVPGTGTDMCSQGSEFPLCATGDFGVPVVVSADKPEDEFFIAVVDEEGNIEVSTAAHGIVERIETHDSSIFTGFFIIMKLNHITGGAERRTSDLRLRGLAEQAIKTLTENVDDEFITATAGYDKSQPSGCLLDQNKSLRSAI